MKLLRVVVVAVAVSLLLPLVEITTCDASCPVSMDDGIPAAVEQEAGQPPVGHLVPRRLGALLLYVLRLRSAGTEELAVVRREGRRDNAGEGTHVQGHLGKGADDGGEHP